MKIWEDMVAAVLQDLSTNILTQQLKLICDDRKGFSLISLVCSLKQKPFELEMWTMHWLTMPRLKLNFN